MTMKIQVFRTSEDEPVTYVTHSALGVHYLTLQNGWIPGNPIWPFARHDGATALVVTKAHATPGLSVTFEQTDVGISMHCGQPNPPHLSSPTTPTGSGLANMARAWGRWITSFLTKRTLRRMNSRMRWSSLSRPQIESYSAKYQRRVKEIRLRTGQTGPPDSSGVPVNRP